MGSQSRVWIMCGAKIDSACPGVVDFDWSVYDGIAKVAKVFQPLDTNIEDLKD
jgi:hypothetical protein